MAVQTTYALKPDVAYAGMLSRVEPSAHEIASFYNQEVSASIPAGYAVVQAADVTGPSQGCKLPASASDVLLGIAMHTHKWPYPGAYGIKEMVPVVRRGVLWVPVEEAIVKGDPVFVRHAAADTFTALGAFRKSDSTTVGSTSRIIPAVFLSASQTLASGALIALVEIDLVGVVTTLSAT